MRLEKSSFDTPEANQHQNGHRCRRHGESIETESGSDADCPGQPHAGTSGCKPNGAAAVQEDTSPENPNSGDQPLQDAADIACGVVPSGRGYGYHLQGEESEQGGADGNQRDRAEPRRLVPQLAIEADEGPQERGDTKPE